MSQFKLRTHYPIYNEQGEPVKTLFELYTDTPSNMIQVYIPGLHRITDPSQEKEYIEKCMKVFHAEYFAEIEFRETTKKVEVINSTLAQTKIEDQRRDSFIDAMVMQTVMSGSIVYGVVYKKLAELMPKATVGTTYDPGDIVVIEDPEYKEVNGEGKLIFVQFNKTFTYNGEPVRDFVKNGRFEIDGIGAAYRLSDNIGMNNAQ